MHEFLCNLGGAQDTRHSEFRDWLADKSRDAFGGRWMTEQDIQPPLVRKAGHIDGIGWLDGAPVLIDAVVPSNATKDKEELRRRRVDTTRVVREAEKRKKKEGVAQSSWALRLRTLADRVQACRGT